MPRAMGLDHCGMAQRTSPHPGTQTLNGQVSSIGLAQRAQHGGWLGVWAVSSPVTFFATLHRLLAEWTWAPLGWGLIELHMSHFGNVICLRAATRAWAFCCSKACWENSAASSQPLNTLKPFLIKSCTGVWGPSSAFLNFI